MNPNMRDMLYESYWDGFYPADLNVVVGNVVPKKEVVMAKIKIELQTAENGVYFTHDGKTLVFTDPSVLGDHLFDMALDAGETYNVFIKGVPSHVLIPQIKFLRTVTPTSLKEAKDIVDLARVTSTRQLILQGASKDTVNLCIRELASWSVPEISNCLEWEVA